MSAKTSSSGIAWLRRSERYRYSVAPRWVHTTSPGAWPTSFSDLLDGRRNDRGVAQRRDVAQLASLGDVAQQPAHDLAAARLRHVVGPDDALGPRELADPLRDGRADLRLEVCVALAIA